MKNENAPLLALLQRLPQVRILCVGDIMLDEYIHGDVKRISPEAPVPVFHVKQKRKMLGGVGNVLRNIHAAGGQGTVVAVAGDDEAARDIHHLLEECHATIQIQQTTERQTTRKTRFMAGIQQVFRQDEEKTDYLSPTLEKQTIESALNSIHHCGALVLSDYGKGVLSLHLCQTLIKAANKAGVPIIVDPKGKDYRRYRGASFITPNRQELTEASGLPTDTDNHVVTACELLIEEHNLKGILATRSEKGMTLVTADGAVEHFPAQAREVYDVSGAGDTVVAFFAMGLALKARFADTVALANAAAGIVVSKIGTAVAHPAEIRQMLAPPAASFPMPEQHLYTLSQLEEKVQQWKAQGKKVGFTNGCFDLLHAGHVQYLSQARQQCDYLIVGLNSDASVKRLKGDSRPVNNQEQRRLVLAGLAAVDAVVLFEEDTPRILIERLLPSVLIKGQDYKKEDVVGADIVEANGGTVWLAPLVPDTSTTATVEKIRQSV